MPGVEPGLDHSTTLAPPLVEYYYIKKSQLYTNRSDFDWLLLRQLKCQVTVIKTSLIQNYTHLDNDSQPIHKI